MQKYAAIDIGTNSMRLLLAEIKDEEIIKRKKYINPTRIGSSVDKNKLISEEGIIRNIKALQDFVIQAKEYGAEKIVVMATSAVRDAANGKEFIQRAYDTAGVNVQIISGEEEATLGYKGVIIGLETHMRPHCSLVIDIGGGSTELILGQGSSLKEIISLNIGAVRMTERHITTDPISKEEYKQMKNDIYKVVKKSVDQIKDQFEQSYKDSPDVDLHSSEWLPDSIRLIGIGGTITTLAALHQQLDPYNPDKVHNYKLTLGDITTLKQKLQTLTVQEIKTQKGIHPKRADIILAGITILHIIMTNLNMNEITVSEYDNLEGLVHSYLSID